MERQERLLALVRAHGARLIGPNCLGHRRRRPEPERDLRRALGAARATSASPRRAARSGSRCSRRRRRAGSASRRSSRSATRPTSPRTTCSSGGRTTRRPTLVLLYVESFGNPRRFGRLARRVARRKPILALKSGTTAHGAARGELAHGRAGGLGGGRRRALPPGRRDPRRARSRSSSTSPRCSRASPSRRGRRVAVLTNAGGLGILCADACEAAGLELPELGDETREALAELLSPEASVGEPGRHARRRDRGDVRARRSRSCSQIRGSTPRSSLFVPTVTRDRRRGGARPSTAPRRARGGQAGARRRA